VNSWKVILATLVIYGAGVITGGLLVHYTAVRANVRPANRQPGMQAVTPWQMRNRDLLRRMERELDLTAEQRTNIDRIIIDSQERTRSLWRPIVPLMGKEMQIVHDRIRSELTPEQQKRFDALLRQNQNRPVRKPNGPADAPDRGIGPAEPAVGATNL